MPSKQKFKTPTRIEDQHATIGETDRNGFLKVKLRFARAGVLPHLGSEIGSQFDPDALYGVLVSAEELFSPESMASLEGLPLTAWSHAWQLPGDNEQINIGAVAGEVTQDGEFLCGKALITDPGIQKAVQDRELVEISCGMTQDMQIASGVHEGIEYAAIRRNIVYNHVTLLPPDCGRNGKDVRVTDQIKKEPKTMTELIKIDTGKGFVSVSEHDVPVIKAIMDSLKTSDATVIKQVDQLGNLEETMTKVTALNEQIESLKAENGTQIEALEKERDELKGSLAAAKAELDKALSPELIAEAAAEMTEMAEVADTVGVADKMPENWKQGSLDAMRKTLATTWMTETGMAFDAKVSDDFITGVYTIMKNKKTDDNKTVCVARVVDSAKVPAQRTPGAILGFPKKEAK